MHLSKIDLVEKLEHAGGLVRIENFLPSAAAEAALHILETLPESRWEVRRDADDTQRNATAHRFYVASARGRKDPLALVRRAVQNLLPEKKAVISAGRYSAGDHIAPHDDLGYHREDGKLWSRDVAVIFYLTKDWTKADGGALLDLDPGAQRSSYVPLFNSLVSFVVPREHAVTAVRPRTGRAPRYSLFGWFLVEGDLYRFEPESHGKNAAKKAKTKGGNSQGELHERSARNVHTSALVNANLIDFLADQMGEGAPKESVANKFRELFVVIFDEQWDPTKLQEGQIRNLDNLVLKQLRELFSQSPQMSQDMILWKYGFGMHQESPDFSLDLKGLVGVYFPNCTLVHAFAALGFERSLDFVLSGTRLLASPSRDLKVAMHTPLETAAKFGRLPVVELLVKKFGVDPLETLTPESAQGKGKISTAVSPLLRAVADGRAEVTRYLLDMGADPLQSTETHSARRMSLIRLALGRGLNDYIDVLRILLDHGANPDLGIFKKEEKNSKIGKFIETPLMTAAMMRKVEVMQMLYDRGADPSILNQETQSSLLHVAASVPDNAKVVAYILSLADRDVDPLTEDKNGVSPWFLAKDVASDDDGANMRMLSKIARQVFQENLPKARSPKQVQKLSCLTDVPKPTFAVASGDYVRLSASYRFLRHAKGGLRTKESFWARVTDVHSDSIDVEIADVLVAAQSELQNANYGDVLLGVPLKKIQAVFLASNGHHPDDE
ncbi:Ankyrin repeat and KH domain-containing protein 1 [Hondaea fermentalgiana]|uniref:Ankyrin repeat and KH domain-containing protein 1 n=1 Tax=Hondaea fermentalgiana TaxID=2315210 RepID=A0A2R5G646_9STRA|nr:Ankyrin repeat and KH domain-containing protein 1 [Hondaea fermentalgiana]|eukprot:GBG25248.1 Ankyrin repeat and KH domain-containing protein 1 [Hondaea fermentalgiana]